MDAKLIRRVKRWDKLADRVITGGGLFVIICVLGILVLIAQVAIPLFLPPQATVLGSFLPASGQGTALAVGTDDYLESAWQLTPEGVFSFHRLPDGAPLESLILEHPEGASRLLQANPYGRQRFSLAWDNGAVSVVRLVLRTEFSDTGARRLVRSLEVLVSAPPLTALSPASPVPVAIPTPPHSSILTRVPVNTPRMLARAADPSGEHAGSYTRVVLRDASSLFVEKVSVQTSLLGEAESDHRVHVLETGVPGAISALTLDEAGNILFAGTSDGHLLRWDLSDLETPVLKDRLQAFPDGRAITTLALLLGDVTLLVGDSRGGVSGWFPVPQAQGELKSLALIHRLLPHSGPVVSFQPGNRSKTAASLGSSGATRLDHLTSENTLLSLEGDNPQRLGSFSPRDDAFAALDDSGRITVWTLRIPHPEVSWGTYFSPQWYENYPKPDYVWQSSSGSDDSEPKLSLMPLVFGTLKGTFWGMLFAAPLAILSALYTSHLMHPALRRWVKPAFEIMGSVPTVVIGFLAALWLAPIVKASLTAFLLFLGLLPLTILSTVYLYDHLGRSHTFRRLTRGYEFAFMLPTLIAGFGLAFLAGHVLDGWLFSGGLPLWLFDTLGVRFDQRNSIVISCALGFAVLPVVFTISDDALSNVPRNLTSASLALGASRWQTVWRVVLPSASPGIFAALMVGLGRAIGETMIVLMATGNTPIMDWSVFNGMRTLSANIAVEIPEAPLDSTLYRTLFLSAVLLFLVTFFLNTLAEVVRQRLRRKFGQF